MKTNKDAWRPFGNLQGFVQLILLIDWDPIGILGYPTAMDEYDNYVAEICDLLHSGATRESMAQHLEDITRQKMGIRSRRNLPEVADKLILVYKTIRDYEGRKLIGIDPES